MIFSHTQISQYLRCPRSYRYRYLDGWREKGFARCYGLWPLLSKRALAAYFFGETAQLRFSRKWEAFPRHSVGIQEGRVLGSPLSPGSSPAGKDLFRRIALRSFIQRRTCRQTDSNASRKQRIRGLHRWQSVRLMEQVLD